MRKKHKRGSYRLQNIGQMRTDPLIMHTIKAGTVTHGTPNLRFWLVSAAIPLLLLGFIVAAKAIGGNVEYWVLKSQIGVLESLTGGLALAASIVALATFFHPAIRHDWKLRIWIFLLFLATLYFAGEDLNWGQYYFGWDAPQYFQEHNREQETNLHNMSPWLNQKPRLVFEFWLLIAGILVPLGWRLPQQLTRRFISSELWPDGRLIVPAMLAFLLKVPDWFKWIEIVPQVSLSTIRWSEVQELYFAYCMLLYAHLVFDRIRQSPVSFTAQHRG